MIIETATVWALSALFITMLTFAVYMAIFFFIWFVIGWGVTAFLRSIASMMYQL